MMFVFFLPSLLLSLLLLERNRTPRPLWFHLHQVGREVSQGTTTDSGDRNGDKENILPMPRGVDVDVSGVGMGMEKRRIMNEKEENELVDWALKSWGLVLMW